MKIKKYTILLLVLLIFLNISSIYATDNNTAELEINNEDTVEINENTLTSEIELDTQTNDIASKNNCQNELLGQSNTNEILTQNNNEDILSDFMPFSTQITLTVNDTTNFETTGNITINMHFSFATPSHDGEFATYDINVYENNTLIKKMNIGELDLPDVIPSVTYNADVLFTYTVHDNSYLTTSLFGVYSNTLQFEKIKKIDQYTLNNTNILINNQTIISDNTWRNNITSIKKALELIKNNQTLQLNDVNIIQDKEMTIALDKNITIVGHNSNFTLQDKGLLFEINPQTCIIFINLTFIGNNPDIIYNKGKVKFINCTFRENNIGLITNTGEMEIENCQFREINQVYIDRSTSNQNGLIKNSGILKITKTVFSINNDFLPYNLPIESETLKAIIYNNGLLTINNTAFKNLKERIIYNEGVLALSNTIMGSVRLGTDFLIFGS